MVLIHEHGTVFSPLYLFVFFSSTWVNNIFAYLIMGFFLGLITLMDEGLELALGWHYANNVAAALLVTADWTALQTDSIYKYVGEPDVTSQILPALIIFPILIYHFSVKYKWSGWKEKLFGKVKI